MGRCKAAGDWGSTVQRLDDLPIIAECERFCPVSEVEGTEHGVSALSTGEDQQTLTGFKKVDPPGL